MMKTQVALPTPIGFAKVSLTNLGTDIARYGLAWLLVYIGCLKFFPFEAKAIEGFISHSFLMSWMYKIVSVNTASSLIGVVEVGAGITLVLRHWFPRAALVGSLITVPMFLTTLTFLFTTPGVLSPESLVGQFLMKDIVLLAAGLISAGEILDSNTHP